MYNTTNTTQQTVATDSLVNLGSSTLSCCKIAHDADSSDVTIKASGNYLVLVNMDVITAGTTGNIIMQLFGNNNLISGARATVNSATANGIENISFQMPITVLPNCCAIRNNLPFVLTIKNLGVDATVSNVSFTLIQ